MHQKCWPSTVREVHAARLIVGSPNFVKASVSCRLPFTEPTRALETCLRWIKVCGRPHSQSNVSKILLFLESLEVVGISHTKGASEPVK